MENVRHQYDDGIIPASPVERGRKLAADRAKARTEEVRWAESKCGNEPFTVEPKPKIEKAPQDEFTVYTPTAPVIKQQRYPHIRNTESDLHPVSGQIKSANKNVIPRDRPIKTVKSRFNTHKAVKSTFNAHIKAEIGRAHV